MSNTQTFSLLPCPLTGLSRFLRADLGRTIIRWTLHRSDNPAAGKVVDLYEASRLRQEFGD